MLTAQCCLDCVVKLHPFKDCYINLHPTTNWVTDDILIRSLCSVLAAKTESVIAVYIAKLAVMQKDTDVS